MSHVYDDEMTFPITELTYYMCVGQDYDGQYFGGSRPTAKEIAVFRQKNI